MSNDRALGALLHKDPAAVVFARSARSCDEDHATVVIARWGGLLRKANESVAAFAMQGAYDIGT